MPNNALSARPKITLNMAASIDGKTTTFEREKVRFSSDEDRALMEDLRSRVDAVLIGAGTLRTDDPPLILRIPEYQEQRSTLKGNANPLNVVVSARLDFPIEDSDFFKHPDTEKLVFTTARAPLYKRTALKQYAEVIEAPETDEGMIDLCEMTRIMVGLEITHLLLEGGGNLNFGMLQQHLIDEIYLTLCPYVIGGGNAPTIIDGHGFPKNLVQKLLLESCQAGEKGEIFLKYQVDKNAETEVQPSTMFRKGYVIR